MNDHHYNLIYKIYTQLQFYGNELNYDQIEIVYNENKQYPICRVINVDKLSTFEEQQNIEEIIREHNCSYYRQNDNIIITRII